jgi:hypothetical protein
VDVASRVSGGCIVRAPLRGAIHLHPDRGLKPTAKLILTDRRPVFTVAAPDPNQTLPARYGPLASRDISHGRPMSGLSITRITRQHPVLIENMNITR